MYVCYQSLHFLEKFKLSIWISPRNRSHMGHFFACQSGIPKGKKLGSKNLVTLSLWRLVALWGLSLTVYSMYKVCGLLSLLHDGVYWLLCLLHDGVYWLLGLLHDGVCILLSLLYDGVVDNFWVLSLMRFF